MYRRSWSYAFKLRLDLRLCKSHMMTLQSATKAEPNASQAVHPLTPLSTLSRRRTRICLDQRYNSFLVPLGRPFCEPF